MRFVVFLQHTLLATILAGNKGFTPPEQLQNHE